MSKGGAVRDEAAEGQRLVMSLRSTIFPRTEQYASRGFYPGKAMSSDLSK